MATTMVNDGPADKLEDSEEHATFAVEKVVDTRIGKGGRRFYKVQWADSWEPEENLDGCYALIQAFWDEFQSTEKGRPYQQKSKYSDSDSGSLPECPFKVGPVESKKGGSRELANEQQREISGYPSSSAAVPIGEGLSERLQSFSPEGLDELRTKCKLPSKDGSKASVDCSAEGSTPYIAGSKGLKISQEKKERLLERLNRKRQSSIKGKLPIQTDDHRGCRLTSESPASGCDKGVKEEPASADEEETDVLKRTAKLKASYIIRRYLELEEQASEEDELDIADNALNKSQCSAGKESSPNKTPAHHVNAFHKESPATCLPTGSAITSPLRDRVDDVAETMLLRSFRDEFEERVLQKQREFPSLGSAIAPGGNVSAVPSADRQALYLSTLEQIAQEKARKFCSTLHNSPFDRALYQIKSREFYSKMLNELETSMKRKDVVCSGPGMPPACLNFMNPVCDEPIFGTDITINIPSSLSSNLRLSQAISEAPRPGQVLAQPGATSISTAHVPAGAFQVAISQGAVLPAPSCASLISKKSVTSPLQPRNEHPSSVLSPRANDIETRKGVGVMPSISLPNGRRIKLVPDGDVPENVKKYVQENYDRILKDVTACRDPCLRNSRLLVHPDGTIEMSAVAVPKSVAISSASVQPEVIDLLDDNDEDHHGRSRVGVPVALDSIPARTWTASSNENLPTVVHAVSIRDMVDCARSEHASPHVPPVFRPRHASALLHQGAGQAMGPRHILGSAAVGPPPCSDRAFLNFRYQAACGVRASRPGQPIFDGAQVGYYGRFSAVRPGMPHLRAHASSFERPLAQLPWQQPISSAYLPVRNGFVPPLSFDAPILTSHSRFLAARQRSAFANSATPALSSKAASANTLSEGPFRSSAKGSLLPEPGLATKRVVSSLPDPPQSVKRLRPGSDSSHAHVRTSMPLINVPVPDCSTSDRTLPGVSSRVVLNVASTCGTNVEGAIEIGSDDEGCAPDQEEWFMNQRYLYTDPMSDAVGYIFPAVLCKLGAGTTVTSREELIKEFRTKQRLSHNENSSDRLMNVVSKDPSEIASNADSAAIISSLRTKDVSTCSFNCGVERSDDTLEGARALEQGVDFAIGEADFEVVQSEDGSVLDGEVLEMTDDEPVGHGAWLTTPLSVQSGVEPEVGEAVMSPLWKCDYPVTRKASSKRYFCVKCGRYFRLFAQLSKHFALVHRWRRSKVVCVTCRQKFACVKELRAHVHTGDRESHHRRCGACDIAFDFEFEYANHRFAVHRKMSYRCSICRGKFVSKILASGHCSQRRSAPLCDAEWRLVRDMQFGVNASRLPGSDDGLSLPSSDSVTHVCRTCGKGFLSLDRFQEHEALHSRRSQAMSLQRSFLHRTQLRLRARRKDVDLHSRASATAIAGAEALTAHFSERDSHAENSQLVVATSL